MNQLGHKVSEKDTLQLQLCAAEIKTITHSFIFFLDKEF